jgi:excisionase family DNA binding protein
VTDSDLITLDQAAALIPGADADTLKRRARQGKLTTYRPGKAYLTTRADVQEFIRQCRVIPKVRVCGSAKPAPTVLQPLGSSSTEHANAALALALAQASKKKPMRSART